MWKDWRSSVQLRYYIQYSWIRHWHMKGGDMNPRRSLVFTSFGRWSWHEDFLPLDIFVCTSKVLREMTSGFVMREARGQENWFWSEFGFEYNIMEALHS